MLLLLSRLLNFVAKASLRFAGAAQKFFTIVSSNFPEATKPVTMSHTNGVPTSDSSHPIGFRFDPNTAAQAQAAPLATPFDRSATPPRPDISDNFKQLIQKFIDDKIKEVNHLEISIRERGNLLSKRYPTDNSVVPSDLRGLKPYQQYPATLMTEVEREAAMHSELEQIHKFQADMANSRGAVFRQLQAREEAKLKNLRSVEHIKAAALEEYSQQLPVVRNNEVLKYIAQEYTIALLLYDRRKPRPKQEAAPAQAQQMDVVPSVEALHERLSKLENQRRFTNESNQRKNSSGRGKGPTNHQSNNYRRHDPRDRSVSRGRSKSKPSSLGNHQHQQRSLSNNSRKNTAPDYSRGRPKHRNNGNLRHGSGSRVRSISRNSKDRNHGRGQGNQRGAHFRK